MMLNIWQPPDEPAPQNANMGLLEGTLLAVEGMIPLFYAFSKAGKAISHRKGSSTNECPAGRHLDMVGMLLLVTEALSTRCR